MASQFLSLLCLLCCANVVFTDWTASIRLINYSAPNRALPSRTDSSRTCCCACTGSNCCSTQISSLVCVAACNTRFVLCANGVCVITARDAITTPQVNFGNTFGGYPNPIQLDVSGPLPDTVNLDIDIYHFQGDSKRLNLMANFRTSVSATSPSYNNQSAANIVDINTSYQFSCSPNFYGSNCSIQCVPANDNTAGHYRCDSNGRKICLPGYRNVSNNCLEGDITCRRGCHAVGGYCNSPGECLCRNGWEGNNCSKPICSSCSNGNCVAPNNCSCIEGWTGSACDVSVCSPSCNSSNGQCFAGRCICGPGWTGETCNSYICNRPCNSTGGTCTSNNTCTCNRGWTGDLCDVELSAKCRPGCNQTGGYCMRDGECICRRGWSGVDCSQEICPSGCSNSSSCDGVLRNTGAAAAEGDGNWSMIGALVSIVNAIINSAIIFMLLLMCICYFTRKGKEYGIHDNNFAMK